MLEISIIFIFVILTMILLKFQKKLMPEKYFYFGRLMDGFDEDISLLGIFVRVLIPFVTSFCVSIVAVLFKFNISPGICAISVGFMSAFLLVWPDFYNPELISAKYQKQKKRLFILYFSVMILFSIAGYLGYSISMQLFKLAYLFDIVTNFIDYLND